MSIVRIPRVEVAPFCASCGTGDSLFSSGPMLTLRTLASGFAILVAPLAMSCSSMEPRLPEHNIGVFLQSNLPCVRGEVNGHHATLVIASALPRTALHSSLRGDRAGTRILLGKTLLTYVRATSLDIAEIPADGLLGADAFRGKIATLDYFRGLLIVSDWPKARLDITPWRFAGGPPRVPVRINGRATWAIVDSALPDTAIIPGDYLETTAPGNRATVAMEVAGIRFETLDVAVAPIVAPRLGSRVLARFVVTIDYAHETVGLWPDPRTSDAARR